MDFSQAAAGATGASQAAITREECPASTINPAARTEALIEGVRIRMRENREDFFARAAAGKLSHG